MKSGFLFLLHFCADPGVASIHTHSDFGEDGCFRKCSVPWICDYLDICHFNPSFHWTI
jgi:hypothetical protein